MSSILNLLCNFHSSKSRYCLWGFIDLSEGNMERREDTIAFKCALWKLPCSHSLGWAYDINFPLGAKIKSCCQCCCCVYNNICDDLNVVLLQLAWEQALFFCAWFYKTRVCPISKRMCRKEHDFWWESTKTEDFPNVIGKNCSNTHSHLSTLTFFGLRAWTNAALSSNQTSHISSFIFFSWENTRFAME